MSSFFADISGEAGKFDDPSEDFQACYTQADYTLIPLTSLVLNSPTITCTIGSICNAAYGNQTDTLTCLGYVILIEYVFPGIISSYFIILVQAGL